MYAMYGEGSADVCERALCPGCLVAGRRLVNISDCLRCNYFLQIINEIPVRLPEEMTVLLCWECAARLTAAVNFRRQVKSCYQTLWDHAQRTSSGRAAGVAARAPRLREVALQAARVSLEAADALPSDRDQHWTVKREDGVADAWTAWEQSKEEMRGELKDELEAAAASPDHNSFTLSDEEELKYLVGGETAEQKKKKDKRPPKTTDERSARSARKRKGLRKEKFTVVELSPEELTEERERLARSEEFVSAEYKCERCLVTFIGGDAMELHARTKHFSECGVLRCATCDCAFRSASPLRAHAARHLRRYECARCAARHASRRRAALHRASCAAGIDGKSHRKGKDKHSTEMQDNTGDLDIVVDAQESTIDAYESQDKESVAPKSTSLFPCELCSKSFRWKTSLRKHAELHRIQSGQKEPPYCDACRLSFTTTSNYQKHVKTSSKHQIQLKVRKLKEQPAGAEAAAPIDEIRASVHSALSKFACPHCDKRFQWKGNLLRHIQSHKARANGELYCAPCDRKFSSVATYQQHMKISKRHVTENEFRYMCSDCGRKFANKTRLKDHVDWEHLKVYTHTCPICQKVFKSNTSLYLHKQVVHRKDSGDHLCDHCGKPFPNRAKLRSHITAMHTSEQPYKCKLCVATFSWHSCLSRHVKVVHHKIKTKRKRKYKDGFGAPAQLALATG